MKIYINIILFIICGCVTSLNAGDMGFVKMGSFDILLVNITKVYAEKPEAIWSEYSAENKLIERGLFKIEYKVEQFLFARDPVALTGRNQTLYPNLFLHEGASLWVTENLNPKICSGVKEGDRIILVLSKPTPLFQSMCVSKFSIEEKDKVLEAAVAAIESDLNYYKNWIKLNQNQETQVIPSE